MKRDKKAVPALMFHSVGLESHPWEWSYISESLQSFEAKIALFRKHGFHGVSWDELYDHMSGHKVLPDNAIFLTFDDGYLDNWVYVYPILKKYNMKGTVFVSPDFVDPATELRPNLDDVTAGRCKTEDLEVAGFLSWAEMREMESSGLIDIQSHAMTHTWYFSGPRILNFHTPHDVTPNPWLFWNAKPEQKYSYLTEDQQSFLPWGYPIFEHQKSLTVTRFFPDEGAIAKITNLVAERGGRSYFERPDWRAALEERINEMFVDGIVPGRYETEVEREARILGEVQRSREIIGKNLGKTVDYICWPGGANDKRVQEFAREVGYKSWTLSSSSQQEKRNVPGSDPESIKRIGTSNMVNVRGEDCGSAGPSYQLWNVIAHQGSPIYGALTKLFKLFALLAAKAGLR